MKFNVGDKVDYVGNMKGLLGCSGVIVRMCPILSTLCTIVKVSNGDEKHMLMRCLKLKSVKNQQLLFNFVD